MIMLLSLISKVPFIGTLIKFVGDRKRLVIEYVMIAVVVTMAGALFTLWLEKRTLADQLGEVLVKVEGLEIENKNQDIVIEQQTDSIETLQDIRKRDSDILTKLFNDYGTLSQTNSVFKKQLQDLEKNNESVQKYMHSDLPAELNCVLNETCTAADSIRPEAGNRKTK